MRRKRIIWAVAVGVVVLAVVIARLFISGNDQRAMVENDTGGPIRQARLDVPLATAMTLPTWLRARGLHGPVSGHVLANGNPAADVAVQLAFEAGIGVLGGSPVLVTQAKTGADGAFGFGKQPSGEYIVSAVASGYMPVQITINPEAASSHYDSIILALKPCQASLYGSVTDSDGVPIAGARVAAGIGGVASGSDGKYSICVRTGTDTITISGSHYSEQSIAMRIFGDTKRDFELIPESIISGEVIDEGSDRVAGAIVTADPDVSELPRLHSKSVIADDNGQFQIDGLSSGKYEVIATAADHASDTAANVAISPESPAVDVKVVVRRRLHLDGHVVTDGHPVVGALVRAISRDGRPSDAGTSNTEGSFSLTNVPAGALSFTVQDYEVISPESLSVDAHYKGELQLEIKERGKLHGHVSRQDQAVPDAEISCVAGMGKRADTTSDRDGNYILLGLPSEGCSLGARDLTTTKSFAPRRTVTVPAGEDQQLDIDLASAAGVRGVVVDAGGAAVPGNLRPDARRRWRRVPCEHDVDGPILVRGLARRTRLHRSCLCDAGRRTRVRHAVWQRCRRLGSRWQLRRHRDHDLDRA
jgi:hypothetical protein